MPSTLAEVQITGQSHVSSPAALGFNYSVLPNTPGSARLEDVLVESGLGSWDASGALGLASSVQARGFSVNPQSITGLSAGKILLNGHPDMGRRFVRDAYTVESVSYFGLTDAVTAGASTPAGTVALQSKTPTGVPHLRYGVHRASNGLVRLTLDAEQHAGPLQWRLLAVDHQGDKTIEGVTDRHSTVLLSSRVEMSSSTLFRLDVESQTAHLPFPFGTVYAGNQWWYDRSYVSAVQSQATRQNDRFAAYWDQSLGDRASLHLYAQRGLARRNEDLLGFWSVIGPQTLDSYARHIDEKFSQNNWGFAIEHSAGGKTDESGSPGFWRGLTTAVHHVRLAYGNAQQTLDFVGPQSIGAFTLDAIQPVFNTVFSNLTLLPRSLKERYTESQWSLSDRVLLSPQSEVHVAATRNRIHIDSSAVLPMVPVADHSLFNFALTISRKVAAPWRIWTGWGHAFEPNRGAMKTGDFLPPKLSKQWEIGSEYKNGLEKFTLAVYDVHQLNVAGVDPSDKNYLVPVGAVRSSGLQWAASDQFRTGIGALGFSAGATLQRARTTTPVSASQGPYLPGMADRYGSFNASWQACCQPWPRLELTLVAMGPRPGDSAGTFFAPGAVIWHATVSGKIVDEAGAQWSVGLRNLFDQRYIRALSAADYAWQGERRRLTFTWQHAL